MQAATLIGAIAAMALAAPVGAQSRPPAASLDHFPTSAAEVERMAGESFDVLDVHRVGWISSPAGTLYRLTDLDADGQVTKAEFIRATRQRFSLMDADRDGELTKAERDAFRARARSRRQSTGAPGGQ